MFESKVCEKKKRKLRRKNHIRGKREMASPQSIFSDISNMIKGLAGFVDDFEDS